MISYTIGPSKIIILINSVAMSIKSLIIIEIKPCLNYNTIKE